MSSGPRAHRLALTARWDTEQLMDLVMTVGFYTLTAMSLNAFRVELDPGL